MSNNLNFPHQRLLISALLAAGLLFISSLISYYLAIHQPKPKSEHQYPPVASVVSLPHPTAAVDNQQVILTPQDNKFGSMDQDEKIIANGSIKIGRDSFSIVRGFVSFDLSDLTSNKKIKSANFRIYQSQILGNPYKVGGNLRLDEGDDYVGVISNDEKIQWKELDVTNLVKNTSKLEFILHLRDEAKGVTNTGDFIEINDIPQLVINFE